MYIFHQRTLFLEKKSGLPMESRVERFPHLSSLPQPMASMTQHLVSTSYENDKELDYYRTLKKKHTKQMLGDAMATINERYTLLKTQDLSGVEGEKCYVVVSDKDYSQ
eukprot:m.191012 g.191012  ORF g.191012 m.191012 type:complete len:108 (-) comp13643_c2_seq9:31-354(-)